jgi:hypothetical protein
VKAIEWTAAHRLEALRRIFEIVATLAGEGRCLRAIGLAGFADYHDTEHRFREWLLNAFGGKAAPVDREVRRVDRLARGEWARETVWLVNGDVCEGGEVKARMIQDQLPGAVVARRTRIGRKGAGGAGA